MPKLVVVHVVATWSIGSVNRKPTAMTGLAPALQTSESLSARSEPSAFGVCSTALSPVSPKSFFARS